MIIIACLNPRIAYLSRNGRNPKSGNRIVTFASMSDYDPSVWQEISVPCGKCIECRKAYAHEWANRCMCEAMYHRSNWFVTLTYNDACVPVADNGNLTLDKDALSGFIKRLRKNTGQKIRYYGCGEYGSHTMRPHYHVIIFGLDLVDVYPWRHDQRGYDIYRSPTLEQAWSVNGVSFGNVECGVVNWSSCCYVAQYVEKKVGSDREIYKKLGVEPEYVRMSRRPGIGYQYFVDNYGDIYNHNKIYLSTDYGSIEFKPPRYFDKRLDVLDHDAYMSIKDARLSSVDGTDILNPTELHNSNLDFYPYMRVKTENLNAKLNNSKGRLF